MKAQLYAQTLSSPEYPREYPNGLECVWKIDAPQGQLITLTVSIKIPTRNRNNIDDFRSIIMI